MSLTIQAFPLPLNSHADGVVRVKGTRVTLDTVVASYRQGATAEEIVQDYPTVSLADVHAVISFYLRQQAEVDAYLKMRQAESNTVREENERRFASNGLRERLLARRSSGK